MRYLMFIFLPIIWGCVDRPVRYPLHPGILNVSPVQSSSPAPVVSVRRVLFELPEYQPDTDNLSEPL